MSKAPVSACFITRGDSQLLRNCIASIDRYVAEVIIVDNMPSFELDDGLGRVAYTDCNDANGEIADFSKARNKSFERATHPWIIWADSDDEIVGAENLVTVVAEGDAIAKATGKPVCFRFPYEYAYHDDGTVKTVIQRERLISDGDAFRWEGACHETLNPQREVVTIDRKDIVWKHRRPAGDERAALERNVRILKVTASPKQPRTLFYLANDYASLGLYREAMETFVHYFECVGYVDYHTNEPEAIEAAMLLAWLMVRESNFDGAARWAGRAVTVLERCPDAWWSLGKVFYDKAQKTRNRRDWERAVFFAQIGLAIDPEMGQRRMFHNARARVEVDTWLHFAMNEIGDVKGALESARRVLTALPTDLHALHSEPIYAKHLGEASVVDPSLPEMIRTTDTISTLVEGGKLVKTTHRYKNTTPAGKLSIDFVCGLGWEVWNPEIFRGRGMAGGAEGAVIEVSDRLASMGHRVRVFAGCGGTKRYGNVEWIDTPTWDFSYSMNSETAVIWRNAGFMYLCNGARKKLLWLHDVYPMGDTTMARSADRIVCMSDWHIEANMKHLDLPRAKFAQTSGGIDVGRFDKAAAMLRATTANGGQWRMPHRAVWISSLDRGLNELLDMWLAIRASVPDAELHVFYGFETWKKIALQNNDEAHMQRLGGLLKKLVAFKDHGVVYHDRVGHVELAAELLKSGVWLYPTTWCETFCQAAAEAQAAGLRMVTTPVAALNETVGKKGRLVAGDPTTQEFHARFTALAIDSMLNTPDEARMALQQIARDSYSWDAVADGWEKLLQEVSA